MPLVQRYGDQKVGADALPGVRKTAAETPLSEGAGLAEAQGQQADQIGRLAGTVGALATEQLKEERLKNDDLASLAAQNALAKASADITTKALAVQGKDSLTLTDTTSKEFTDAADAIEGTLVNDRQRAAFARVRSQHDVNLYATVGRHISQEMQTYRASELQSAVDLGISAVAANALDPRRGREELDTIVATVKQQGPALGWGPQELDDHIAKIRSTAHVEVVKRLVDNNQPTNAKIYYEEAQREINGAARGDLEKLLAHSTQRADGQREADAIIAGGGTLAEQRAKAKEIDNPDTRAAAMTLIEHEAAVTKTAAREADESLLDQTYANIKKTGKLGLTATQEVQLGSHLPALQAYALKLAKGEPATTDPPTFYARLTEAGNDPAAFATRNLLADRNLLDDGDWKHLAGIQLALRKGNLEDADKELAGFRMHSQIVDDTLAVYGIDSKATPGTPEDLAISQLRRMLDKRVEAVQAPGPDGKRKKVTTVEVQQALDDILSTKETTQGSWWGLNPFSKSDFFTSEHKAIATTIGEVPDADRTAIESRLKARGEPVSSATIVNEYVEGIIRKKAKK